MNRTAFCSVTDKTSLVEFTTGLRDLGIINHFVASGGTRTALQNGGIEARDISDWVGGPAILEGLVKTISYQLAATIMANRNKPEHMAELERLGVDPVYVVVCNPYKLEEEIARPGATRASIIAARDVGGCNILNACSKGETCIPVCDPADYQAVLEALRVQLETGVFDPDLQDDLRAKAAFAAAHHAAVFAEWLSKKKYVGIFGQRIAETR
jgi:phosphoribosylaminoimidazolecarboxamide formyltransferase/IMP cyclohydrolase